VQGGLITHPTALFAEGRCKVDKSPRMPIVIVLLITLILLAAFMGGFYIIVRSVGIEGSLIWSTLVAAIGWIVSEHISRRREHQKLLAEQKREMYFNFLDFILFFIDAQRNGRDDGESKSKGSGKERTKDKPEDKVVNDMRRWSLKLTLVGSDGVVKAWNAMRAEGEEGDTSRLLQRVAGLLTEMRKDCGHHGTSLSEMELLSVMIKAEDLQKLDVMLRE